MDIRRQAGICFQTLQDVGLENEFYYMLDECLDIEDLVLDTPSDNWFQMYCPVRVSHVEPE
jgi:hypothetical protein